MYSFYFFIVTCYSIPGNFTIKISDNELTPSNREKKVWTKIYGIKGFKDRWFG